MSKRQCVGIIEVLGILSSSCNVILIESKAITAIQMAILAVVSLLHFHPSLWHFGIVKSKIPLQFQPKRHLMHNHPTPYSNAINPPYRYPYQHQKILIQICPNTIQQLSKTIVVAAVTPSINPVRMVLQRNRIHIPISLDKNSLKRMNIRPPISSIPKHIPILFTTRL